MLQGQNSFTFVDNVEVMSLVVIDNIDYFYFIREKYWYGNKFVFSLRSLLCHFHWYEDHLKKLNNSAYLYDLNSQSCGNGFRSFVLIFERCFSECYTFCKQLKSVRNSLFFTANTHLKRLNNLISILEGLRPGLIYITKMLNDCNERELLPVNKSYTAEELMIECGMYNQLGFYGRYQGFYYCPSMSRTLQGVSVIMAAFSDLYQNEGGPVSRAIAAVLNGAKYILNPEKRAQQIVNVAQNSSVEFLKAFWSLSETHFMKQLPSWVCPRLEVIQEIFIPCEPITLHQLDTHEPVTIPAPSSHIPPAPVRCLLLSSVCRQGQVIWSKDIKATAVPSRSLLFHCHGGGFISQNPESHEIYLRHWAHDLNVPILSIDYSLSPEAPFPRALEEVLLAYAWALNNPEKLGWTGENICFAGDSAGGNILMGTILKTICLSIRQPNAVLCAYTPLILDMVPSPSRLLCWLDPLLPLGFMVSCLDAYAGAMETDGDEYDDKPNDTEASFRQRKVSSISDILDSSLMFIKQCEWIEVEANEPPANESENSLFATEESSGHALFGKVASCKHYITNFFKQFYPKTSKHLTELGCEDINEHALFDFPQDVVFDVKKKCFVLAGAGCKILSDYLVTTSIYKKFILPLLPLHTLSNVSPKRMLAGPSKASILQKIKKLKIMTRNPFMSPLLVSDEYLKQMPPVYFVSCNFDPCLDDSVTFAKRLAAMDRRVVFDALDGLPHGFLNFLPFSQEAHNGSNLCVAHLKEALSIF